MSEFLSSSLQTQNSTSLLSTAVFFAREGFEPIRSMNYRNVPGMLSVLLVLPNHGGEFKEEWDAEAGEYSYYGHDSVTQDTRGKSRDQLLLYGSGRVSDNGKFFKAAQKHDAGHKDLMQVQVYEKIDTGIWFDKGIFDLIGAKTSNEETGKQYVFLLRPADFSDKFHFQLSSKERMLSAAVKSNAWGTYHGRCAECGSEAGLRFVPDSTDERPETSKILLRCASCRGEQTLRGFLG